MSIHLSIHFIKKKRGTKVPLCSAYFKLFVSKREPTPEFAKYLSNLINAPLNILLELRLQHLYE